MTYILRAKDISDESLLFHLKKKFHNESNSNILGLIDTMYRISSHIVIDKNVTRIELNPDVKINQKTIISAHIKTLLNNDSFKEWFKYQEKINRAQKATSIRSNNSKLFEIKYKELYDTGYYSKKTKDAAHEMWTTLERYSKDELGLESPPILQTTLIRRLGEYKSEKK